LVSGVLRASAHQAQLRQIGHDVAGVATGISVLAFRLIFSVHLHTLYWRIPPYDLKV